MQLGALEERLGYTFRNPELLRRAMCHRSWVAESDDQHSNERLEFLGDAVLGWVIADVVFQRFPDLAEGALTDLRKGVVNANALADAAVGLDLGQFLLLGRGEDAAGGREKVSILSDAMEAVFGAVYVDGGTEAAFCLIERLFTEPLDSSVSDFARLDYKSALQELVAQLGVPVPEYKIESTGPDHDKTFFATLELADGTVAAGEGRSKKSAEQAAAGVAFAALNTE